MPDTGRITSEAVAHLGGTDRRVVERAMRTGLVVWPLFAILDAYMCFVAYPGAPFPLFVLYRVVIELVFVLVYRASLRETIGREQLFRWLSIAYVAPAFTIALMAIPLGGIRSPYMHGISIVALVWTSFWLDRLQSNSSVRRRLAALLTRGRASWPVSNARRRPPHRSVLLTRLRSTTSASLTPVLSIT